jgi:hypothetical protein
VATPVILEHPVILDTLEHQAPVHLGTLAQVVIQDTAEAAYQDIRAAVSQATQVAAPQDIQEHQDRVDTLVQAEQAHQVTLEPVVIAGTRAPAVTVEILDTLEHQVTQAIADIQVRAVNLDTLAPAVQAVTRAPAVTADILEHQEPAEIARLDIRARLVLAVCLGI